MIKKSKTVLRVLLNILIVVLVLMAIVINIGLLPGIDALSVESGSMEPALPYGSLIFIKPQDEYRIGDYVTFRSKNDVNKCFTHQIIAIDNDEFTTKGLANLSPDPEPITAQYARGKVIFTIPFLGLPAIAFKIAWVKTAVLVLLIAWLTVEIIAASIKSKNNKEKAASEEEPKNE